MKVRMNGKTWEFVRVPLKNADGYCDAPTAKGKRIRVDSRLGGVRELETIIHELMHAGNWFMDEEHVHLVSHDLARILDRLGYHRD